MKTSTIVNDRSGSWARYESLVSKLAGQSGSPIFRAGSGKPVRELILDAMRGGCERLIVAGGDGSVSRIVNAMGPAMGDLELAILPTGTGNDLARSIGIFGDSLEVAWRRALEGSATPIDLIQVSNGSDSILVNAATGGFGGKVSTDVKAIDKQRWGAAAYWMTAFFMLSELRAFEIRLEMDHATILAPLYSVAIANGRYVGGGFPIAPMACVNDGLFEVTTIPVLPPLELLAAGVDFTLGRHQDVSPAKTYQTSMLRIHSEPDLPISLDGEPSCTIDATFRVLPRALPIVCGRHGVAVCENATEVGRNNADRSITVTH